MSVLNNAATTDNYSAANTVQAARSVRVRVLVRNAAIAYQFGYGGAGGRVDFDSDQPKQLLPGTYSLDQSENPVDGIRVRSWTPGTPAVVTIDCVPG